LITLLTLTVLAAGAWGLSSALGAEAPTPTARIGEPVAVPGGFLLVDKVTPEHMAAMRSGKFAASGMNMSGMGMDMAPEGTRRFAVDITLAAEGGDLSYSPEDFRVTGEEMKKEAHPIRHRLGASTIPAGSAVSGSLVFQVPEAAKELVLSLGDAGGRQQVALDLGPASQDGAHPHGAAEQHGGEHADGHHGK
jgi:hypothetical protein